MLPYTKLGEYDILWQIAEGGMGIVLKAQHRLMQRTVAIKTTRQGSYDPELEGLRFNREIEPSARLSHPNVLTAFDAGTAPDGRRYLVTEFIEGQDLLSLLRNREGFPIPEALNYVIQAAIGLQGNRVSALLIT